ncbi:MAG: hypothetical protein AAF727_01245 [Pseudomonadota bacterium]
MKTLIRPRSMAYTRAGGHGLALDLYHPGDAVRPLVLFGYGGGFTKGSRDANVHQPLVQHLCAAGFAVAVPDYRLKTGPGDVDADTLTQITRIANRVDRQGWGLKRRLFDVRLFTACADLSAALRFCAAHAGDLGIAPGAMGMFGISAGALAGNTMCYPPGVWQGQFARPDVMVSLCAPVLHPWRIRRDGPPLWLIHGRKDRIIPAVASAATAHAAQKTGAPITVALPPDAPHVGIDTYVLSRHSPARQLYRDEIVAHLRAHLAPVTA